jgi:DNA-directed RNA polymerase subunit RPC12/RpoP
MNGTRKTEIYCHECERYFTVELDLDLDGNHEIKCPNCGHTHYRVIEKGRVTGERYQSSMGMAYTYSIQSYSSTYTASSDNSSWQSSYGSTQSSNGNSYASTYTISWASGDSTW